MEIGEIRWRKVAIRGLLLVGTVVWISNRNIVMDFLPSIPLGGVLVFLISAVAASTILWYTLFITLLILGDSSQQVQYLIPVMGVVGLFVYFITTVP